MNDSVIHVENAGKFYPSKLTARRLLRYLWPKPLNFHALDFWALRNVSFSLEKGHVLGMIGRNGSGKSTLLQLIAGLLEPSEGEIRVSGNTAALLELGAGFNPEFTGRENIYLSGAVYGFNRDEMKLRFEDIVAFANIGEHLDQPVKTYSSGMFARLAFAVAIQVDPDILIVDEILSVGDIGFQAKCYRRIEELRDRGASILFVSHDLNTVQTLCDQVLLLDQGSMICLDEPKKATHAYLHLLSKYGQAAKTKQPVDESGKKQYRAEITDFHFYNTDGVETIHPHTGERCRVRYRVTFHDDVENPIVTLQFKTMLGLVVCDQTNMFFNKPLPSVKEGEQLDVEFEVTLNLCPGPFRIGVSIADIQNDIPVPLYGRELLTIEVISDKKAFGIAFMDADFSYTKSALTEGMD